MISREMIISYLTEYSAIEEIFRTYYEQDGKVNSFYDMEKKYAFFILDIDNFKQANDLHGHDFGDYVIIRFTDIMKSNFRTDDILGRIGGDEFVVFIPVNDMESTIAKAELLVSSLRQTCSYHSSSWNITSSIGIALYPDAGTDFDTLYKNADTALYESKRLGKNRYSFFRE